MTIQDSLFEPELIRFEPTKTLLLLFQKTRIGMSRGIDLKKLPTIPDSLKNELIAAQAKILDCPELRAIQGCDAEIDRYLAKYSNPSVFRGLGIRQVSLGVSETLDTKLREYKPRREALISAFVVRYADVTAKTRESLGPVVSAAINWPNPDLVDRLFSCSWRWIQIDVPEIIQGDFFVQELNKQSNDDAKQDLLVKRSLRTEFATIVNKLLERVTPTEDGKKKIIRDSAIGNFRDFLEALPARYTAEDVPFENLLNAANKALAGLTPDDLRGDPLVIAAIRDRLNPIVGTANGLASASRVISFEEEPDAELPQALNAIPV